jgi:hypothetical protein
MAALALPLALLLSLASSAAPSSSFPTFADMGGKPYTVGFDKRALQINDEPALFILLKPIILPRQARDKVGNT